MLLSRYWNRYKPAIRALPTDRPLTTEDLLTDDFLMERHAKVAMYYAPHNEYLNPAARILIVGITPGFAQMRLAFETAQHAMEQGVPDEEIFRRAKEAASFAGSMRANLTRMLNELGLQRFLGISSCADLFHGHRPLLHTTSMLRFPVFVEKRNYSGKSPDLASTDFLREAAKINLTEELNRLNRPLVVPLGKTVEKILRMLEREGTFDSSRCLWGFPHPSGANAHRHRQFDAARESMITIMQGNL